MDCYCCSGQKFADCCQLFIDGKAKPPTAAALMRSRFTAYRLAAVEYLLRSTHPSTRKFYAAEDLERWARSNRWEKLEIIRTIEGDLKDKKGTVEFKAFYVDENLERKIHHELSNFRKELGKWFFVDGQILS